MTNGQFWVTKAIQNYVKMKKAIFDLQSMSEGIFSEPKQ